MTELAGFCPVRIDVKQSEEIIGFDTATGEPLKGDVPRLDIQVIDPLNFWFEETSAYTLIIHRKVVALEELKEKAEERGYDKAVVNKIEAGGLPDVPAFIAGMGRRGVDNVVAGTGRLTEWQPAS